MILEVAPAAKEFLVDKSFDVKYGARPLRRTLQREIEDPLSTEILKGKFGIGSHIKVGVKAGKIAFGEVKKKPKAVSEAVSET